MATEFRIPIRQLSETASEATMRTHRVIVDRPVTGGGTDTGPMGGELFLTAIGGCFMSNLLAAMRAREAAVTNVRTEVIGTAEGTPPRFSSVDLIVTADTDDPAALAKLVEIADRGCIMLNTLRGKLDVKISITEPCPPQ